MELMKTDKTTLSEEDILKYIADYELEQVPELFKLWEYYRGKNTTILERKAPDQNTPDNKVPIPYGRKIVTTFTGYAYRPRYITYKPVESEEDVEKRRIEKEEAKIVEKEAAYKRLPGEPLPLPEVKEKAPKTAEDIFASELQDIFDHNNEHIKTSRAGRNTGIFGLSYEILYIKGVLNKGEDKAKLPVKAEVRFFSVDPREMILLYNYDSEPEKVAAIRYYKIDNDYYKVEVFYLDKILQYDRKREKDGLGGSKWKLTLKGQYTNFFGEIPVVAYYFGDEMNGVIDPVVPMIDAYDVLVSDSLNEFDRFAYAYLIMKRFGLTDPTKKKEPGVVAQILRDLKKRRVFENLPKDAEIEFLTKDIPDEFITFMTGLLKEEIHVQSHVPDFASEKFASGVSGIAVQRLLFDFENVVSSTEADFDVGLMERIRLITIIMEKSRAGGGSPDMINISHKRNIPLNLSDFAKTSKTMKEAGFSSWLCADIMPDDVVPNVEEELERQKEEREEMMPDIDQFNEEDEDEDEEEDDNLEGEE